MPSIPDRPTLDDRETITRLAMNLSAVMPLVDRAAQAERRREAGKPLRQITWQDRAKRMRQFLDLCAEAYGLPL
jgi:hypothetical protein